ncbi:MAG: hypothetical protein JO250_06440 [Armatimonadetes bacterium]|nr:hypothetical protein [Armatimonadota bacterium]
MAWLPALLALGTAGMAWGQTSAEVPPVGAAPAPTAPAAPTGKFLPRVAMHLETEHGKIVAVLTVNETEAASIRTNAGGFSPQQRAQVAAERLTGLLQAGLTASDIVARPAAKPLWDVEARGGTLLLATPEEADAHRHMSPEELARAWVKALRQLIGQPPLTLSPASLVVPLGETRTVKVGGAATAADVQVGSDNAAVSVADFDPARRLLTVRGHAPGRNTITVQLAPGRGVAAVSLPVAVMKYAGQVAPSVTVQVTGRPDASPDLVTQAAYAGLIRALSLEDGAQVTLTDAPRFAAPLAAGEQTAAVFPLRLSGPDLLPVTAKAAVNVVNTPVTPQPPSTLFYSNNPEQVKRSQTLFTGRLRPASTARLDYHHQNMSGQLLVFHVDLVNASDAPATVQVIAGLSQPGGDTVQVGRRAGAAFLKSLNGDAGLVLPVPPRGRVPLVTQRLGPGLTVSGLMQLQCLSGGPLTVRVSAGGDTDTLTAPLARVFMAGAGANPLAAPSGGVGPAAGDAASPYIFPRPLITLSGKYVVDRRWAFVTLGDKDALRDSSGKLKLFGNYGADYQVDLTLTNPTRDTRQVGVYFAPGAGPAAAVFQVDDGPIQEFDPFEPPNERELARVTLAPGETRVTRLRTIPLNGSAYPAQVVARALERRPAPPVPPGPSPPATNPAGAGPVTPAAAVTAAPPRKVSL